MRVNWLAVWRRLAPLWVCLWLVASVTNPTGALQHVDGSYCEPCTVIEPVRVVDECCENEASAAGQSLNAVDCRQCCEPASKHVPTHFVAHSFGAVTLGAPFQLSRPVQREVEVFFPVTSAHLQSLPRPPPRGRAPPFEFSFT